MTTRSHVQDRHQMQDRRSLGTVLRGLQFRWTVMLTSLMLGLAVTGDILIRRSIERLVTDQQFIHARRQCGSLAAAATTPLSRQDRSALQKLARRFDSDPHILYIEFLSEACQLLSARHRDRVRPPPLSSAGAPCAMDRLGRLAKIHAQTDSTPPYVDVIEPAVLPSMGSSPSGPPEVIGYVRMGVDLTDIHAGLANFLQRVRYTGIAVILGTVPLVFMLVHRVTAPLNELSRAVRQLASDDKLQVRANINRSDEIGQLASSFNAMADKLASENKKLVNITAELEARVQQRTRELKEQATRDALTGLHNRRHFSEMLTHRFAEAERYESDLSCMMMDLDNFKKVNDQFGHETGDTLLSLTSEVIKAELRASDIGARFGGDEFCILLPQTPADQAHQVGLRIVERFQHEVKNQLPEECQHFGVSVGVAGMRELRLVHPDELMKAADQALYAAKDSGKNRTHLAESFA